MTFKVTREIHFCYGHRLMNYQGKCSHPHGHNGRVEIELSREKLDDRSMVVDFEEIKQQVQTWIDNALDHQMLLRKDDPLVKILKDLKEPVFVMDANPTAEAIAKTIYDYTKSKGLPVTKVTLWETEKSFATYQP